MCVLCQRLDWPLAQTVSVTCRTRRQPLPEKHSLLGHLDRYQRDFIRSRMALLHRFMNRVADHPVLSCNDSFRLFLVSKPAVSHSRLQNDSNTLSSPTCGKPLTLQTGGKALSCRNRR